MDPYKISTAVLAAILVAIGIAFLMKNRLPMTTPTGSFFGFKEFCYVMVLFLPHILVVFGFVADALSQDFRYSIPSIVGFVSLILNWGAGLAIGKAMGMMSPTPAPSGLVGGSYDTGCSVPGFEWLSSSYSSAPMVVTFTIMSYYMIDLWQNRGFGSSVSSMIATAAFSIAQFIILKTNGCFTSFSNPAIPFATSAVLGLLFGGSAYGIVQAIDRNRLPTTVYARETQTSSPAPSKKPSCPDGTCAAPSDEDQFVCDTYVNGMPVTA